MAKCEDNEGEWEVFFIKWARRVHLFPKNISLYKEAFTHPSYFGDINRANGVNNRFESLEFLGDAVLSLAVVDHIVSCSPSLKPGELTLVKSKIVNRETLANIAKRLNIHNLLILGKSEEMAGGREKASILEDALESFIGCIYIDKGWEKTKKFIHRIFAEEFSKIDRYTTAKDPKNELQEYCQKAKMPLPIYKVIKEEGPDHRKKFQIGVILGDKLISVGEGSSKKDASQTAAKKALYRLRRSKKS